MIAHNVQVTVFCKEDEENKKIIESLKKLFPFDLKDERIDIEEKNALGFEEKVIKIYEVVIDKKKHVEKFIENLIHNMSDEVKERVLSQAVSRIDDSCKFYLRFDKYKWVDEGELFLTDKGNCFHIKVNLAVFPKDKNKALELIQKIFIVKN